MGRGSLADPYLPQKAKDGELTSIRYCLGCMQGCSGAKFIGKEFGCLVNPEIGKEWKADYTKTEHPKKVYIAGGGPGGLNAARIAAVRGHEVTLFEKRDFLGGLFKSAAYPPFKGEFATYTAWLIREVEKAGVAVKLNTALTKEMVEQDKPDVVIVATGGTAVVPPVKGIDNPKVVTAEDVLLGKKETGNNVVIIGGGEVGAEVAGFVSMAFKKATIVEMLPDIMPGSHRAIRGSLMDFLRAKLVQIRTSTKVCEIKEDCVVVEDENGVSNIKADTVILAVGYRPDRSLADELEGFDCDVRVIGGAVKTSTAWVASEDGYLVGMDL